ncbi:hypothetical protein PPL_05391 [Heterostelium album PN500]|uniref:Ankyrin repeat-containing protein n=1 Tax=Heterostelium pallidum (strain ATCC 26659 / Pp 5 / PN500) TaxID=670386 RepID=D3BA19_HETP5|nr:hypothetical protein PPL_05391 [Heterostelium album PN500]EFA81406.1 hypothetical protein PPL_05391 [Heterostelium album PN500]|eukprot:XP_020433524.1 hypothetical protein PPL_05391 [Heterostelium album PN500]
MEILEMMVDLYNATSIAQDNSYVESKTSSTKNVFNSAAFVGSVQMIEYLCKERLEDLQNSDLYMMAIDAGQVETVRYLIANFSHLKDVDKCKSSSGTVRLPLDFALTKKNTDITIMLIEANCKTNFTNILGTVANYYGDCKLMDYLYSRGHRLESYPLDDVTMFDSILWLDQHGCQLTATVETMDNVIPKRYSIIHLFEPNTFLTECLNITKYLHFNRSEGCTTKAMENGSRYGSLEIIRFLHENRTEGCSEYGMNVAAFNGFLDILKYKHYNKIGGCSKPAMDNATGFGHFEIIQFLHYNRSEGCSGRAMDNACSNGHYILQSFCMKIELKDVQKEQWIWQFTMVIWNALSSSISIEQKVVQKITERCTKNTIYQILKSKHVNLENIQWLHRNYCEFRSLIIQIKYYFDSNKYDIIEWVLKFNEYTIDIIEQQLSHLKVKFPHSHEGSIQIVLQYINSKRKQ